MRHIFAGKRKIELSASGDRDELHSVSVGLVKLAQEYHSSKHPLLLTIIDLLYMALRSMGTEYAKQSLSQVIDPAQSFLGGERSIVC